ncbi:uncharacterized protein LOC121732028 [Aricia agestis]|uniref:uncharacterized protein LOC121732028 n=1 Tax=Aricia agestis TaxID=91739 RepID=UPI001C20B403|nr:uncharacterized protein LOC121732028 [Aricia agestis]
MLLALLAVILAVGGENDKEIRVSLPLQLPSRNDKAEQCWLRIEDVELTETLAIYCFIAQGFLRNFVHDYNNRKMLEDNVDVSLWAEEPRSAEEIVIRDDSKSYNIVDWKLTTIKDPTTKQRLYVTKNATCRLIMISREAMTNYKVDCDKILYFVNVKLSGASELGSAVKLAFLSVLLIALLNN